MTNTIFQSVLPQRRSVVSAVSAAAVLALCLSVPTAGLGQEIEEETPFAPEDALVPPSLQRQLETPPPLPPPGAVVDEPDEPRVQLGDDAVQTVVGKLAEIDGRTLTVESDGEVREYVVSVDAKLTVDGNASTLSELSPQDIVRMTVTRADPKTVVNIVAVHPAGATDAQPGPRRRQVAPDQQGLSATGTGGAAGGRVWVVVVQPGSGALRSGIQPGDMILVVDGDSMLSGSTLGGLSENIFPLQTGPDGQVMFTPTSTTGLGTGLGGQQPQGGVGQGSVPNLNQQQPAQTPAGTPGTAPPQQPGQNQPAPGQPGLNQPGLNQPAQPGTGGIAPGGGVPGGGTQTPSAGGGAGAAGTGSGSTP